MSNIPLTEGNLQSLQRSQQYGSNPAGGSGLLNSALMDGTDGLLMGNAPKDPSSAPYLSPEAADSIVAELLQQYFHVQEWQVPWPRPKTTPLLYVPDTISKAFDVPKAPTAADLDAMSLGIVESIPFVHDLLYPEHDRVRAQLSKDISANQQRVNEQGLHAPYQSAKERNPALPDEDFALIDVDFCSAEHGQRHLPSITFLQRPSYTEIGLAPAERREEERRAAVAQSMPNLATLTQQSALFGSQLGLGATQTEGSQAEGGVAGLSQWNVHASRTFKHAKQLDVCYEQWISDASSLKLGLLPVHGHSSALTPAAVHKLTARIMSVIGYITANGVVIGSRRNDTNQNFYNQQQGKLLGGILWKNVCILAAEAWGQFAAQPARGQQPATRLFHLDPAVIVARILDDTQFDTLTLGSPDTRALLQGALEDIITDYTNALKQSVQGNKKAPCPLVHTEEDFVSFPGMGTEILPEAREFVPADASALAQRRVTAFEGEVQAPLIIASNVPLHPTLSKIADSGEVARRLATAGKLALPTDQEAADSLKHFAKNKGNTVVPLCIMPVFPENFTRIAQDPSAPAYVHDFGNTYRNLQHVVLNGERNTFTPGAYVPADARTPNVLFNDRLHFRPIVDPAAAIGSKRTRRGALVEGLDGEEENDEANVATITDAYTTGTTENKFEKYLADQSSTMSYLMKVVHPEMVDTDNAATAKSEGAASSSIPYGKINNGFPIVTYARIPTLTRFKRAQVRHTADDVLKTVSISWTADESEAKDEQLGLVEEVVGEAEEGNDNAAAPVVDGDNTA